MPGLRPECIGAAQDDGAGEYCCICEENECGVALSRRGSTILFVDGEEAVVDGSHCDCIIALRRGDAATDPVDLYSVELKRVEADYAARRGRALSPDVIRQKCENCLAWAEGVIRQFRFARKNPTGRVRKHCVIALPANVIENVVTLIKREKRRYIPSISDDLHLLPCNSPLTGHPIVISKS